MIRPATRRLVLGILRLDPEVSPSDVETVKRCLDADPAGLMHPKDAACLLGYRDARYLHRAVRNGVVELTPVRIGRVRWYREREVMELVGE